MQRTPADSGERDTRAPAERIHAIADILAAGVQRLLEQQRRDASVREPEAPLASLDLCAESRPYGAARLTPREQEESHDDDR